MLQDRKREVDDLKARSKRQESELEKAAAPSLSHFLPRTHSCNQTHRTSSHRSRRHSLRIFVQRNDSCRASNEEQSEQKLEGEEEVESSKKSRGFPGEEVDSKEGEEEEEDVGKEGENTVNGRKEEKRKVSLSLSFGSESKRKEERSVELNHPSLRRASPSSSPCYSENECTSVRT